MSQFPAIMPRVSEGTPQVMKMKAAVYRRYGPPAVVAIEQVAKPVPRENEVLIRVRATTVSSADWRLRSLEMPKGFGPIARPVFGLFGPRKRILGTELSGDVEAVGKSVTRFRIGDTVFAFPGSKLGAHAEYRVMPEDGRIAQKPSTLSYNEAAAISFGGSTALHFLRDVAKLQAGESVLILGASGAVGSAAVQLARHAGAKVTGVCSAANADIVRSIGADHVIDYVKQNLHDAGMRYDVIVDCVAATTYKTHGDLLNPGGRLLLVLSSLKELLSAGAKAGGKKVFAGPAPENPEHLAYLGKLCEQGAFKPLIDSVFSFEDIVHAHARVDSGRKRGSVVVALRA
jgi:NADPH:quinone reductase-like Zn-dependent oxidoreductase